MRSQEIKPVGCGRVGPSQNAGELSFFSQTFVIFYMK